MEETPAPGEGRSGRLLDYSDLRGQHTVSKPAQLSRALLSGKLVMSSLPANLPGFLLFPKTNVENTRPLQKQGPEQLMA